MNLTAASLLAGWERAADLPPGGRALVLLSALAGRGGETPVGERDRALAGVFRALFGARVRGRVDCPSCGEMLELDVEPSVFDEARAARVTPVEAAGCEVLWRLPTAGDLADTGRIDSATEAREELIRRCVLRVRRDGREVPRVEWPEAAVAAVAEAAAAADPLADPRLGLTCEGCGHRWEVLFDISAFLWVEIDGLARRLLRDVHRLASAYGWREREILDMTAARRAAYLGMCER
jgi:hypothetical protein